MYQGSEALICSYQSSPLVVRSGHPKSYHATSKSTNSGDEKEQTDKQVDTVHQTTHTETSSPGDWSSSNGQLTTDCKVGINSPAPMESLTVGGNIALSGYVLRPSDRVSGATQVGAHICVTFLISPSASRRTSKLLIPRLCLKLFES